MTRLDRRALFASGAAAALLAATGLSAQAGPRAGGTLRLAVPREGDALGLIARRAVFETLTEIGPDRALRGELASAWESDADARVWHFDLREGVRFHDGSPLQAADVIASLARLPHLDSAHEILPGRLRLEVAEPMPDLPLLLAEDHFLIAPNGQFGATLADAIGTGCYRVTAAREDRQFRTVRVTDHHRQGHAGWADAVEIIVIPDPAVRAEALCDGFVGVTVLPQAETIRARGDYRCHPSADDMQIAFAPQVGTPARIGQTTSLGDLRIAERWWLVET
ncbi:ABC transporter substrate-binding protein [Ruegeria sp. 2205SS24-7]|uniref:ABC transporter substrate-binding protein n=1 Tax=Ruegeria discodermiae TaxID=3064389 RepID=UPI002740BBE5|nr:ABC transporter substrate-binding protein [Ruegeria sp. 2205SS24-7]MDP5220001.1 ABC transporter substrate-binding protein [Ruegeria sp. 2205SS24-7]